MRTPGIQTLPTIVLLAVAYFVAGRLGLLLPAVGAHITLIWLPTGIAVAALLRWGFGCWPGITLGALAVNSAIGAPWPVAMGIAAGNTAAPLLAAWTLRRLNFHPAFDRKRDILLLAAAAMLGMLISSGVGVTALSLARLLPDGWRAAWFFWWGGDVMGVIAAAPLVFTLTPEDGRVILRRSAEFFIWFCATCALAWAVFVFNRGSDGGPWAVAFVPLPLVAWGTLRFGGAGTSLALIVLAVGAAYGTATGRGPFYRVNTNEGTVVLWIYMATSAVLGWLITALHSAQIQATGIRQLFEKALSEASFGVLLTGIDRRITYANHGFTRLTGYAEEEMLGKGCTALAGPDTDPATLERFRATPHGDGFFDGEILNYRKDGTTFWNALLVSPVRGEDGKLTGFLCIMRDITSRKQVELALHESEARFRKLIEFAPEAIQILDVATSRFVQVNPASERLFKMSAAELCRIGPMEVSPPMQPDGRASGEKGSEFIARAMAGKVPVFEWTHCDGEGREIPCEVRLLRLEIGGRPVVRGCITDITARRQAGIEREQLSRKMLEAQKLESLGVLAGGIAHDFNNLLTGILGNASILTLEMPPGSSAQDCLGEITEASMRAADLCKQMLAYSGRGRFVIEKLDLGQLVEQTSQMLQVSITKKAALRFRLEKGLPLIEGDATQIRQVIMNLVINASEAIGEDSGAISLATGLTRVDRDYLRGTLMEPELPEGDYVFIEVSDSGCGMSPETLARIFDPFYTTKFTGRGLGLAAVLGIVRGHKGALKVYSEEGRGTTFKLLFPTAAGTGENAAERTAPVVGWRGEGTVLVVDDEETMRTTVARMMTVLGLDPVLARDGREAIEVFRADPARFAFVLLDLTMPHMDGEEAFTELRRLRPDVRVVLMSGFNAQEALTRFSGKGLASFLQKPFTVGALRSVLQSVLG